MRDRLYTTADLARVCGVSISTIKRWTDSGVLRCVRTPGGHRKFRVQDVAQAARQLGTTLAQAEASTSDELALLLAQSSRETLCERARFLLERGDAQGLLQFGVDLHRHGMRLSTAAHRVLLRACAEITAGSTDSFVSRRAQRLTERTLFHMLDLVPAPDADAPWAVLGGAPGSSDALPFLVAHLALAEADWNVTDLGPDLPQSAWAAAVDAVSPRLVVIGRTRAGTHAAATGWSTGLERPNVCVTAFDAEPLAADAIEALVSIAAAARTPVPPRPASARLAGAQLVPPGHLGVE